jgi:hypothetical protein
MKGATPVPGAYGKGYLWTTWSITRAHHALHLYTLRGGRTQGRLPSAVLLPPWIPRTERLWAQYVVGKQVMASFSVDAQSARLSGEFHDQGVNVEKEYY